jgi:hypothetical protein
MKVGIENKKQLYIAGGLGFFALLAIYPLYNELFGGPSAPATPPPPVIRDATPGNAVRTSSGGPGSGTGAKSVSAPPGFVVGGGKAAPRIGSGGVELDPTLHMEAMRVTESLVYTGSGRNIFAAGPSPVELAELEKPKAPARPVYMPPPAPAGPTGPPPPPPINLKFFGTATAANGTRRAFLLNGDDVFLASAGDVVQRRYRVIAINANSIQVEDIPNTNKQSLPLVPN